MTPGGRGGGPELAPIAKDGEAHSIEDQAPICHGQALVCVAEDLESLEGSSCVVTHDVHVVVPMESVVDEEPEVSHNWGWGSLVVHAMCQVMKVEAIRGEVDRSPVGAGLLETNKLHLGRFS